jgi:hypothetical protein
MSSHAVSAFVSVASALLKSAGSSCTTPSEIFFRDMDELSVRSDADINQKRHFMQRRITGYHQDKAGDWVAELERGHQTARTSQSTMDQSSMDYTTVVRPS